MKERLDSTAPEIIQRYLMYPYMFFARMYGSLGETVLDIACGNASQRDILQFNFKKVLLLDNVKTNKLIKESDIRKIKLPNKSVDVSFCFETIEHILEQEQAINELKRVTKKFIIIGSVNKDGPTHIQDVVIYKGRYNPFHIKELNHKTFKKLANFYQLYHLVYKDGYFKMKKGLSKNGIGNYGVIKL